jgi:hypothetical protein
MVSKIREEKARHDNMILRIKAAIYGIATILVR